MPKLTSHFVREALESESVWNLGNEVLYKLCADHPDHTAKDVIIAKVWLIGRAYAAAIERRPEKGEFLGDEFYVELVAPRILDSDIDEWFQELRQDVSGTSSVALKVHKKLTDLLYNITELNKRSLASKYLHFHFPSRFFIYDARAEKSVGWPRLQTMLWLTGGWAWCLTGPNGARAPSRNSSGRCRSTRILRKRAPHWALPLLLPAVRKKPRLTSWKHCA